MKIISYLTLIMFSIFFISGGLAGILMNKIRDLIKKNNPEKWKYIASSSNPFLNNIISENSSKWLYFSRFNEFVKEGFFFNDKILERSVNLYYTSLMLCFISAIILAILIYLDIQISIIGLI